MTDIKITDGVLTIEIPGLTAVRIDTANRVVAVDGISGTGTIGERWTVADLRDGTYGGFHRLRPADECVDRDCARGGEHDRAGTWWITTDQLAKRGQKVLGPFATKALALEVRSYMEKVHAPVTYWVDSEPGTTEGN